MLTSNLVNKVLQEIKEILKIEKFDDAKISFDTDISYLLVLLLKCCDVNYMDNER